MQVRQLSPIGTVTFLVVILEPILAVRYSSAQTAAEEIVELIGVQQEQARAKIRSYQVSAVGRYQSVEMSENSSEPREPVDQTYHTIRQGEEWWCDYAGMAETQGGLLRDRTKVVSNRKYGAKWTQITGSQSSVVRIQDYDETSGGFTSNTPDFGVRPVDYLQIGFSPSSSGVMLNEIREEERNRTRWSSEELVTRGGKNQFVLRKFHKLPASDQYFAHPALEAIVDPSQGYLFTVVIARQSQDGSLVSISWIQSDEIEPSLWFPVEYNRVNFADGALSMRLSEILSQTDTFFFGLPGVRSFSTLSASTVTVNEVFPPDQFTWKALGIDSNSRVSWRDLQGEVQKMRLIGRELVPEGLAR